jgi:hypothetical protein
VSNSVLVWPHRGRFQLGHHQRAIIVRMNAHDGYWPKGSSMSRQEQNAMRALVRREIVRMQDDQYYLPYFIRSTTKIWYSE